MRRAILLQTPTVFWLGGETNFSQQVNVHEANDFRQTETH